MATCNNETTHRKGNLYEDIKYNSFKVYNREVESIPSRFHKIGYIITTGKLCKLKQTSKENVSKDFEELYNIWKRETFFLSNTTEIVEHPAYRKIIAMGEKVVPLILEKLKTQFDHFSVALYEITGENPIPEDLKGDMAEISKAWVEWGILNGYID